VIYQFKPGSWVPKTLDPQLAGARLAELRDKGQSSSAEIVEDARPEGSPFHDAFTWDDSEAAQKQRLVEARHLVNSIIVVRDDLPGKPQAPAFVSIVLKETGERAYMTTIEAQSDDEYRRQMLAEALTAIGAWKRRHRQLSELARIFAVIDEVAGELNFDL
jgi:hypothetical protein